VSAPGLATAQAARQAVSGLGGAFMLSPEAKAAGKETGLRGRELYVVGRGGVLGDGPGEAVAAAIGFFAPSLVMSAWEAGRAKAPVGQTVARYAQVCCDWGRIRWADLDGVDRLADLLGAVAAAADPAGWPLFAGWRAQPVPDDAPGRVALLLHVLREHRGGAHLSAVRAVGLTPLQAIVAGPHGPASVAFYGWDGSVPDVDDEARARHARAEELTDEMAAPAYAALGDGEQAQLLDLLAAAGAAAAARQDG
jgi:hypothetical protein